MITPLPEKRVCKTCKSIYIPSKTSNPKQCGNCVAFSVTTQKEDLNNEVRVSQGETIKTANSSNRTPVSTGKLTGETCLCNGCSEIFEKVNGFDKHRRGEGANRYCLTPDEMKKEGMVINARGRWGTCIYEVKQSQDTAA